MKLKNYLPTTFRSFLERPKVKLILIGIFCITGSPVYAAPDAGGELSANVRQQILKVNGKITDKTNEPLIGVTVTVKGTTNGTITDIDGMYNIDVPNSNSVLVFSFIGYKTTEIAVGSKSTINILLEEDSKVLDEVVVTALGIKRQRRAIGYATTDIGGDQFVEARDPNIGNALSGKIAGVSVAGNSTGVGGSSRVVIRGNSSLTGNNQPLYIVDGVPFDNTNLGSAGEWGGLDLGDGLNNINADDIADIQILKGAAASALYGYRGGNGVVMITTKSGKGAKGIGIEFNNNLTFNKIYDYRDFQKTYGQGTRGVKPENAASAIETYNSSWGAKMDGSEGVNILGDPYSYSYVDNWSNFYRTGVTNQTSLSVSGSDEKVDYRVGISNSIENAILPNAGSNQQGINFNTIYRITPKLQLTLNGNYIFEHVKNRANLSDGNGNVNASLLYLANSYDVRWLEPAVNAAGKELQPGSSVYFNNPYFLQYRKSNKTDRNRLTGGATLRYDITDWLYAQGQVTRDGYIFNFRQVQPSGAAADPTGYLNEYERNQSELNWSYLVGVNKKVSDFSVSANFGGNIQRNIIKIYGTDGNIRPFIIPSGNSASQIAGGTRTYKKGYSEHQVNSIYGTAELGYKDWLFLNVTGRNDWFSTLDPDNNSYFYPSVSLSYMFSECFKMPDWITSGKIRASYAASSNGTDAYMTALSYRVLSYEIQGQSVGTIDNSTVPNAKLKPVNISEWEAGANVQFLNNRLGFDMAFYRKTTKDDILPVSTSSASGFTSAMMNIGEIRNTGFEVLVYGVPVNTNNIRWNTSFNIGFNNNKVLYLGGSDAISIGASNGGKANIEHHVGKTYGQVVGFKYKRDENGNRIFDSNGLPVRSDAVELYGSGVHKLTGGFRNDISFKNFTLALLLDFKWGAKLYSGTNFNLSSTGLHKNTLEGREGGIIGAGVTESGTPNTVNADAQVYWQRVAEQSIIEDFVYDASFLKLRELSIGYKLPKSILQKTPMRDVYISLVARNLWTIIKHTPNIDPESAYTNSNTQGLELNGYPITRNIGFNVNVKF